MKVVDVIFALITGRFVGFLFSDFLQESGVSIPLYETLVIWIIFPFLSVFCLWLAYLIGKKFLVVFQAAKHLLVGAFVTIIDLKVFEFLIWILSLVVVISPIFSKAISFFVATVIKYIGNKYWAFQKHEKEDLQREMIQFFYITLIGLVIDVAIFRYLTSIAEPQLGLTAVLWTKIAVVSAGVTTALWNFLGYKFFVFKK